MCAELELHVSDAIGSFHKIQDWQALCEKKLEQET
jgi:hypothetical protein